MVSIKDVAAAAGVSDKTVSRVVNKEANVKPDMVVRVQATIDQLGYIPNQAARLVRTNRSRIIGVITDVVSTTPYSVELIHGIQDHVAPSNYSLLIANTGGDPAVEESVWRTFREHRIDGVLYVTMYHRDVSLPTIGGAKPCVLVNCFSSLDPALPSVLPDDYLGGYNAARYVIDKGHKLIGCFTLNPVIPAAKLRDKGFRDAMNEAGLAVREDWVTTAVEGSVGEERMSVEDAFEKMFAPGLDQYPTAILCGDDSVALQVISVALQKGKSIPGDIAVVGFDDFRMISTSIRPAMTTVALPYYEIGARATERLFALLAGEEDRLGIERIPCPLVARDSA